jgi:5-methylcytosine-specific restriction endonuclease McrA
MAKITARANKKRVASWPQTLKIIRRIVRANTELIAQQSLERAVEGDLVALALIVAHSGSSQRKRRTQSIKREFIRRFERTCHHCGQMGTLQRGPDGLYWHLDHLIPLGQGGSDDDANLVLSCDTCNRAKGISINGGEEEKTDG